MSIVVVAAMLAFSAQSAIAAPSDEPMARPDVAQSITQKVTGSTGRELRAAESKQGGFTINHAKSATGTKTRTLVQDRTDGFAVLAVLEHGQSSATFDGLVPAGSHLKATKEGGFQIIGRDGTQTAAIKAPWAQDANGRSLPTAYTAKGTQVIQTVDTRGATFPIVADPSVSTDFFFVRVNFSRAETTSLNGRLNSLPVAAAVCGFIPFPPAAVACGLINGFAAQQLVDTFAEAARITNGCVSMRFTPFFYLAYVGADVRPC